MWKDFKAFMLKQNILALALAVVMGEATSKLVQAMVNDFIMPIISFIANDPTAWKTYAPGGFGIGDFAAVLLNFVIIGFIVWRLTKFFIKEPVAAAKPATRECPYCLQQIDARARRCPHCTSQLTTPAAA